MAPLLLQRCQDWEGLGLRAGWVLWLGPLAGGSRDSVPTLPLRCTPPSGSGTPAAGGCRSRKRKREATARPGWGAGRGRGRTPAAGRGRKRGREAGEGEQVGPSPSGLLCLPRQRELAQQTTPQQLIPSGVLNLFQMRRHCLSAAAAAAGWRSYGTWPAAPALAPYPPQFAKAPVVLWASVRARLDMFTHAPHKWQQIPASPSAQAAAAPAAEEEVFLPGNPKAREWLRRPSDGSLSVRLKQQDTYKGALSLRGEYGCDMGRPAESGHQALMPWGCTCWGEATLCRVWMRGSCLCSCTEHIPRAV